MKILLVNPPRSPHNSIREYAPGSAKRFIHKKLIGPPLGLLTVAGAARQHDVTVLEMKGEYDLHPDAPPPQTLVRRAMEQTKPDVVGITVIASEFPAAMAMLRAVRVTDPSALTVAGGLHATLCPLDFARREVDIVCPGQSAHTFVEILGARKAGNGYEGVEGIYVNGRNGLHYTRDPSQRRNAAGREFVMPERSHLKPWISTYTVGGNPRRVTYLFTSLGCPYRCTFCSIWPEFNGRYFERDVESVIAELKTLDEYGVVRFADANTVVNPRFMSRLFDRIAEEEIRKEYVMDLRADTAVKHPALVEKMARQGLKVVICGFESFRDEELRRYRKSSDARLIADAISILHANDVMIRGNYVVPPDYSQDDFYALAEYAGTHRVSFAGYTILTPMPGTQLFADTVHDIVDFDLAKYNFFNCVLRTRLPLEKFYESLAGLWPIKKGLEVI